MDNKLNSEITKDNQKIKGFKAFNKGLVCRGFQYKEGETYTFDGKVKICESGFHFCQNPLDVFTYYPPTSEFAEVEGEGDIQTHNDDSKVVCKKLHIKAKINLRSMIDFGVKFVFDKIDWKNPIQTTTGYNANAATTGNNANAATTGEYANAATTGNKANAATTGYNANAATTGNNANAATTGNNANAATTGENCISAAIGIESQAKANLNSWLVLAEWVYQNDKWNIKTVKTTRVDGKKIKANVFYQLKDSKFVECSE